MTQQKQKPSQDRDQEQTRPTAGQDGSGPQGGKPSADQKPEAGQDGVEGEGSYTAARNYRDRSEAFVASGQVEKAAEEAAPKSAEEEAQLRSAEEKARSRARH